MITRLIEGESNAKKIFSTALMLSALLGLGALGWFAWEEKKTPTELAELPVIKASTDPFKIKPEDPGGMPIPHTDKMIYKVLSDAPPKEKPEEANVQPPPEEALQPEEITDTSPAPPKPQDNASSEQEDVIDENIQITQVSEDGTQYKVLALHKIPDTPLRKQAANETLLDIANEPPTKIAALSPAAGKPTPPKTAPSIPSGHWIQLGSYKSKDKLEKGWQTLKKSYPGLLGKLEHTTKVADLGERGRFYRLQAGPLTSQSDARTLCNSLKAKKQGCILVR